MLFTVGIKLMVEWAMHIDPTLSQAEPRNVKQVDGEMASHSGSQCDAKSYWH